MYNTPMENAEVIRRTTCFARKIFGTLAIIIVVVVPFFVSSLESLRLFSAYALAILDPCVAVYCGFLFPVGPKLQNRFAAVAGILYIAGGPAFDIYATLVHSADLTREVNLVARALLDRGGHGLAFLYVYGFTLQLSFVFSLCMLWLCFLKQKDVLIDSAAATKPGSFEEFLKAATGAEGLSRRQWMFPIRYSELPRAYHFLFMCVSAVIGGSIYRWWLGLEWFRFVEHGYRITVLIVGMCAGLGFYFAWIYYRYRLYRHGNEIAENQKQA